MGSLVEFMMRKRFVKISMILTVATVRVDSLEETESDPDVHGEDVQVAAEHAVEDGTKDRTSAEDKYLSRVSVLCS